jgi:hypothetical protein
MLDMVSQDVVLSERHRRMIEEAMRRIAVSPGLQGVDPKFARKIIWEQFRSGTPSMFKLLKAVQSFY